MVAARPLTGLTSKNFPSLENPTTLTTNWIGMALTIGVRTYASRADLAALCADQNFLDALRTELGRITNDGERQQARDRGKIKLKKWVTKDQKYSIPWGAKAQGKSFPSHQAAVKWLLYKTQKTFANNQQRESRLAEEVHANEKIREHVFTFLRGPLAAWWRRVPNKEKGDIGGKTGRYSHFYSKLFCNRTIAEGFAYFGVGGAGVFSKTVTVQNLSISEAAAFISDVAMASKNECNIRGRHMGGLDNLRINLTELDKKTRDALDEAFMRLESDRVAGIFENNRHREYLHQKAENLRILEDLRRGDPRIYAHNVKLVFDNYVKLIAESLESDKLLVTVNQSNKQFVDMGTQLRLLAGQCLTPELQLKFLQKASIETYLNRGRTGENAVAGLKARLQPQLDADRNKSPALLKAENPALYKIVKTEGEDRLKRMFHNVDPDHEWTKFMINHDAVVGAGPSGTTSFTLGLVEMACEGEGPRTTQMATYAIAMALFSFWQRKKKLLKYQSAVHTWNEVCAALDHHRGANEVQRTRDQFLQVSDTGKLDDDNGCNLYAYPISFNNRNGLPDYDTGGTTFDALFG